MFWPVTIDANPDMCHPSRCSVSRMADKGPLTSFQLSKSGFEKTSAQYLRRRGGAAKTGEYAILDDHVSRAHLATGAVA